MRIIAGRAAILRSFDLRERTMLPARREETSERDRERERERGGEKRRDRGEPKSGIYYGDRVSRKSSRESAPRATATGGAATNLAFTIPPHSTFYARI